MQLFVDHWVITSLHERLAELLLGRGTLLSKSWQTGFFQSSVQLLQTICDFFTFSYIFWKEKKKNLTTNLIVQMKSLKSAILQLQYDLNLLLSSAMLVLMRQEHLHHPKAQLFITTSWHFKYKLLCLPTSGSSTTKSLLRIVTILLWILMAVKWIGTSPRAYLLHRNYCAF